MAATKELHDNVGFKDIEREIELQEEPLRSLEYSPEEENQAVWRLDIVLIPLYVRKNFSDRPLFFPLALDPSERSLTPTRLSAIYLFSYIDRGNIGNAKTAGMANELKISSNQYSWLVSIYYIAYICFHWVSSAQA